MPLAPSGWWHGFLLSISVHTIKRAGERRFGHFGSGPPAQIAHACAGAIYHPRKHPLVIGATYSTLEERQIAIAFLQHKTNFIMGYLVLSRDQYRAGVVCKTWLGPDYFQVQDRYMPPQEYPQWYRSFRAAVSKDDPRRA